MEVESDTRFLSIIERTACINKRSEFLPSDDIRCFKLDRRALLIDALTHHALKASAIQQRHARRLTVLPTVLGVRWLASRVVSVLDSGAEGPGFKSQPRRCRVTVLGKLFTPIVPLFTKQRNW